MKRIQTKNINTSEEYNRIFLERENKSYSTFDINRWKIMLKYFRGGRLIDLGCFDSYLCQLAKERFPNSKIWGIDFADKVIDFMSKQFPEIKFIVGDVFNLPFEDETFNYVTAGELLEHLESPHFFIKEAIRILKPGGVLSLSCPLEETGIGELDQDRHIWSISKQDIFDLLKSYGVVHIQILRSEQYPVYKYHFPIICVWVQKYATID